MADTVEDLMAAVRLAGPEELTNWLDTVRAAYQADGNVADFDAQFRAAASGWPGEAVDGFLSALAGASDGIGSVGELLTTLRSDPNPYWDLQRRLYPPAEVAVDRFGWLADRQSRQLADAWGGDWQRYLGEQLDFRWGAGWEATYATEGSQQYLDDLIAEWLPAQPEPAQPEPSPAELDRMIDDAIRRSIESTPGADELTEDDVAEMAAEIRQNLAGREL